MKAFVPVRWSHAALTLLSMAGVSLASCAKESPAKGAEPEVTDPGNGNPEPGNPGAPTTGENPGGEVPGTEPEPEPEGSTIVTLSFSDTLGSQKKLIPLLKKHKLKGTFFVNSPRIGQPEYLSLQELQELVAMGSEIGGHTLSHVNLEDISDDEVKKEICDDRVALIQMGFQITSFGYPFSGDDPGIHRITERCKYNSGRATGSLGGATSETMPPQNPYRIRLPSSIQNTATLFAIQDYVTEVEDDGGGWIMISFHGICDGTGRCPGKYEVNEKLMDDFLAWLAARVPLGTVVRTQHRVMGGTMQPPVSSSDL